MQNLRGFPEEYLNLIREANNLKFREPKLSRKKYLEAVKLLASYCTEDNPNRIVFEREARRVLEENINSEKGYEIISAPLNETIWKNEEEKQIQKRKIGMKDVIGLEKLKEEIMLKIALPLKRPDIVKKFKKNTKTGILMYGPPGCGKSLIAEAIANDSGVSFINVKASDIKSKWIGETEKNISRLFEEARSNQPCIIFIDEFESIGRARDEQNHSAEKNFVSEFLAQMDGLGNKEDKIILIAATNEPWNIDSALLRSGRFSSKIFVGIPDKTSRFEILLNELKDKPVNPTLDISKIVAQTKNFSPADLVALSESASDFALLRYMNQGYSEISEEDFIKAMKKIKPVTRAWFNNAVLSIKLRGLEEEFSEIKENNLI